MRKRSIMLIIATVLSTAYVSYQFYRIIKLIISGINLFDLSFGILLSLLLTPFVIIHVILFLVGAIFGWLGVSLRKPWAALVAAILYSVGAAFFMGYIMFGAPLLVLGFIGYANQKKINKELLEVK